MSLKRDHVQFLSDLLRERAGQSLTADRLHVADSRLAPLARREGFASVGALVDAAKAGAEPRLAQSAAEALVDSETSFFRDRAPFEQFRDRLLPALARARGGRAIRVWSAGCGTGQEAVSLCIAAQEAAEATPGLQTELIATDFAEAAVERTRQGLYSHFEVQRGLPIRTLLSRFEPVDDMWRVRPELRARMRVGRVNLARPLPELGRFDVVFCRYVLSDFTPEARCAALQRLAGAVAPGGVLVMGEGESPLDIGAAFREPSGAQGVFQRDPAVATA